MKFKFIITGFAAFLLCPHVSAQTGGLTPEQKAEAANVIAAEYRLQRAWGAAIYGIEQPMEDVAGLVALFKLCSHQKKHFGDQLNGGEWHKLDGAECPVQYERNLTWKGVQHDTHISLDVVDDDTLYSTTDPRVLAELNISSISVSWDIRLQEPSPFGKSFVIDFYGYGKARAERSTATELVSADIKKLSEFNKITLPSVVVEANSFAWIFRDKPEKNFSTYLLNGRKIEKQEYQLFDIL